MDTKVCPKCKESKSYSEFYKHNRNPDGYRYNCKTCEIIETLKYQRSIDGLINKIYNHQKSSCKERKMDKPCYSFRDIKEWVKSKKMFYELYNKWVDSGYNREYRPSIDRIYDYKGYSFDNIQLMTWGENRCKYYNEKYKATHKNVYKFNLQGDLINVYISCSEAAKENNATPSGISKYASGKGYVYKNFLWSYNPEPNTFNIKDIKSDKIRYKLKKIYPILREKYTWA